ncbi:hypothetical protein ONE63_003480 [Megalurothrips usitatus]|uniref:Integrase catalytic domain-containing protein n=1 Tax=Megalurothrips usitatus TaxID=439358 RepID=A0AAV7X7E2_9NEOP|nr:hypothetical protein ONE63_003480 [Megalurothrips usitatus]
MDYAGPIDGHMLLIIIDAFSKWPVIKVVSSLSAQTLITHSRYLLSDYGRPSVVVTDNGTSFAAHDFQNFLLRNGIRHLCSPPWHPSSNGLAEATVHFAELLLERYQEGDIHTRIPRVMWAMRTRPSLTTGLTPADRMGRKFRTHLTALHPDSVRSGDNEGAGTTNPFAVGSTIWILKKTANDSWCCIKSRTRPDSYITIKTGLCRSAAARYCCTSLVPSLVTLTARGSVTDHENGEKGTLAAVRQEHESASKHRVSATAIQNQSRPNGTMMKRLAMRIALASRCHALAKRRLASNQRSSRIETDYLLSFVCLGFDRAFCDSELDNFFNGPGFVLSICRMELLYFPSKPAYSVRTENIFKSSFQPLLFSSADITMASEIESQIYIKEEFCTERMLRLKQEEFCGDMPMDAIGDEVFPSVCDESSIAVKQEEGASSETPPSTPSPRTLVTSTLALSGVQDDLFVLKHFKISYREEKVYRWTKRTTELILRFLKTFAIIARSSRAMRSANCSTTLNGPRVLICEECSCQFSGLYDRYLKICIHYTTSHRRKCNILIGRKWIKHQVSLQIMVSALLMDLDDC